MSSFANRIIHAAELDRTIYEEVEHDQKALKQAFLLVILSSLAGGIGMLQPGMGGAELFGATVASLVGWIIWAAVIYLVGAKWMSSATLTTTSVPEIMRVLGFASAPGLIRIFGVFEPVRSVVYLVALVWMFVAMVIAVRQALDYATTGRAVLVVLIGWIFQVAVASLLLWVNGLLITGPTVTV